MEVVTERKRQTKNGTEGGENGLMMDTVKETNCSIKVVEDLHIKTNHFVIFIGEMYYIIISKVNPATLFVKDFKLCKKLKFIVRFNFSQKMKNSQSF